MLRNHRARLEVAAARPLPTAMAHHRPIAGARRRTIARRDRRKRRFGLGECKTRVIGVALRTHPVLHSGAQRDGHAGTRNRQSSMLTRS